VVAESIERPAVRRNRLGSNPAAPEDAALIFDRVKQAVEEISARLPDEARA
jgi:hypothetical protein